jgi:hypothetical protein
MRRLIEFLLALALTAGGGLWLLFQVFVAELVFSKSLMAACLIFGVGVYWLCGRNTLLNPISNNDGCSEMIRKIAASDNRRRA